MSGENHGFEQMNTDYHHSSISIIDENVNGDNLNHRWKYMKLKENHGSKWTQMIIDQKLNGDNFNHRWKWMKTLKMKNKRQYMYGNELGSIIDEDDSSIVL